jgi:hypothetical protein
MQSNYKPSSGAKNGTKVGNRKRGSEDSMDAEKKRGIEKGLTLYFIFYLVLGEDTDEDEEEMKPTKKKGKKGRFIDDEAEED